MLRTWLVWLGLPLNAIVNLTRGYSLRETFELHRIAARLEKTWS